MTEKKNPTMTPDYLIACKMQRTGKTCPLLEEIKKHSLCQTIGLFQKPIPLEDCDWWQVLNKEGGK